MEYLKLGNVRQQHRIERFNRFEIVQTFSQVLAALQYLHGKSIVHRDIKPENVLVKSRCPDIHVCLADFGVSTSKSTLQTHCGTGLYMAPEISGFRFYTNSVDIWSLAVVILDLYISLPMKNYTPRRSWTWHDEILLYANEYARANPADLLIYLLVQMLRLDTGRRISSQECSRQLILTEASLRQASVGPEAKRVKRPITESSKPESESAFESEFESKSEIEEGVALEDCSGASKRRRIEVISSDPSNATVQRKLPAHLIYRTL